MKRAVWSLMLIAGLTAVLLSSTAAWAKPMTFDKAIDKLISAGYTKSQDEWLASQGSNPDLGFALGGSPAQTARAQHVAAELRKMGLRGVKLEAVPLDAYDFKSASVQVGAVKYIASTFPGVPPTPLAGITGDVVYVGAGTALDIAKAGDVSGKVVLIDCQLGSFWMNWPWTEAALNGASAIIYGGATDPNGYYQEPTALGTFDPEYRWDLVPAVYISQHDADELKAALGGPAVQATVKLEANVTLMRDGGKGYNVVGTIPGTDSKAGRIVIDAHNDAYFHAGLDDTGGVSAALTLAKALMASNYKPQRDITFLFTTGEEWAHIDSYYDWLGGSYYAATKAHRDWIGNTTGLISMESMAMTGAKLETRANAEMQPLVNDTMAKYPEFVPNGYSLKDTNCWNDQWPFTAAGVPTFYIRARTGEYGSNWYHTSFDTTSLVDYAYIGKIDKLVFRVIGKLDRGLLPYDFTARAAEFTANVDAAGMKADGANAAKVDRFAAALDTFTTRAAQYKARAAKFGMGKLKDHNSRLLALEKELLSNFTALDVWDTTTYPHVQVAYDLNQLNQAIAALDAAPVDPDAVKAILANVGITSSGLSFSYENYQMQLALHAPGYAGLFWGGQGHLSPYLDVMPAWNKVADGNYAGAKVTLKALRDGELVELNARLSSMTSTLDRANAMLAGIR